MPCVYLITSPSGKQYVGLTTATAEVRFDQHVRSASSKSGRMPVFHRAIKKYGRDGFVVQTLVIGSKAYCAELERSAIAAFGTMYPNGYNLVKGGEGTGEMTLASRRRKRESLIAAFASPESKSKLSAAQKRIWADPAERAKRAAGISAAFANPDVKARLVAAQKRGNADPAVKARKAEVMRMRMSDPEVKRRTVERMLAARGIQYKGGA